MTTPAIPGANLGQIAYLMSVQANIHIYAVVTDDSAPNLNTITISVESDEATAVVPGLIGKTGPAGEPQFALDLQPTVFDTPADLPPAAEQNFGDYWLIEQTDDNGAVVSAAAYVAWPNPPSFYRVVPFGTQGSIGPYPEIQPDVILIDSDKTSYVENTGTVANPSWTFYLAVPRGVQGPTSTLASCVDFNATVPPTIGQVVGFNGIYNEGLPQYQPMTVGAMNPLPYIVPESAFTSYNGISGSNQTVATFTIPACPWPWKPLVWGQLMLSGIELSLTPLLVGVEVLLGSSTSGTLVAAGSGNGFGGVVTVLPQTSSTGATNAAMTPTNSTALVQPNQPATLYCNLTNDGLAGVYDFTAQNSQLFVLVVPIGTENAAQSGVYGSLGLKVTLQAWSIVKA